MEFQLSIAKIADKIQGFICSLIGKPGSGKTTLIKELLAKGFFKQFSFIILCSPSCIEYEGIIDEKQRTDKFSIEWIYQRINSINVSMQYSKSTVLLILDDCVSDIKNLEKTPKLVSLFFNRRHLLWNGTLSIMITSQKYTMIPARFRSCMTDIVAFNLSPFDVDKVFAESILTLTKNEWKTQISKIYEKEHSYIHLDIDKQVISVNV